MSLNGLLEKFGKQGDDPGEIIITRFLPGEYSGGNFTAKIDRTFTIVGASVQPVTEDDVIIEEKQFSRATNMVKIYTVEKLLIDNDHDGILQKADLIDVDGVIYEAKDSQCWQHLGLIHFKTIATRKNQ